MRESPRRPLILKRRKLPFQRNEADLARDEPDGPRLKEAPKPQSAQCFPDGIRIMDHPTMPDTQVVVIPKSADLQSVIDALTAKGKECGPQGPNKFILLSGSSSSEDGTASMCQGLLGATGNSARSSLALPAIPEGCAADCGMDIKPLTSIKPLNRELDCCPLDDSLTNIQWLGRMSTDGLAPEPAGKASDKENQVAGPPGPLPVSEAEEEKFAVKDPLSERPPYSYMAMIQFAINSKKSRRMTLKEIYLWIEDHFPYFRDVAKPGWKNSIRHNLSLHDMFVRETTPDGKISYWTIRPEANRCLTLDQVYKTGADPDAAPPAQTAQVCAQQQQKRGVPDLKRPAGGSSERKMKPLLPRTDSYLVPIQLPLPTSLYLPPSASQLSLPNPPAGHGGGKRVRIAPKVTQSDVTSGQLCPPAFEDHLKEEPPCVPLSSEPPAAPPPKRSSRRKQRLVLPSREEPVLLFSDSTFFDSGLASDTSAFQDTREAELHPCPDPDSPFRSAFVFKTPVKSGTLPASSTPSGLPAEPWRVTPLGKGSGGGGGALDYSPIRTPGRLALTPQRLGNTPLSFSSTPFKELPLFGSPRELLASCGPSPSAGCTPSSRNGAPNRSLTEGLVLDTMNDSLSKILVDISFSGLEDEELAMSNISWSQLIPDLK